MTKEERRAVAAKAAQSALQTVAVVMQSEAAINKAKGDDQPESRSLPSLQDPEVATLIAALRDIGQAKETRIAHVYKRARQAADLIELLRLREQQAPVSESTATDEGYPGIAHDLETLRSALGAMCEEFRGLDLPYGSKAYAQATTALNATRRPLWKQP